MPRPIGRSCIAGMIAGLSLISPLGADAAHAEPAQKAVPAPAPVDMQKRMEIYRKKLAEYTKAWDAYEKVAVPYWKSVTEKRSARRAKRAHSGTVIAEDYVLTQPPVYTGPPKPKNPEEFRE